MPRLPGFRGETSDHVCCVAYPLFPVNVEITMLAWVVFGLDKIIARTHLALARWHQRRSTAHISAYIRASRRLAPLPKDVANGGES